jgi:hypothetical protein
MSSHSLSRIWQEDEEEPSWDISYFDDYTKHIRNIWAQSERRMFPQFEEFNKDFERERQKMMKEITTMLGSFSEPFEGENETEGKEEEELPQMPHRQQPIEGLLKSLLQEEHPLEVSYHRNRFTKEPDIASLIHAIQDWGHLTVRFPGLIEQLAVSLDFTGTGRPSASSFSIQQSTNLFGEREGTLTLKGLSQVNSVPMVLNATINLRTFRGVGQLHTTTTQEEPHKRSVGTRRTTTARRSTDSNNNNNHRELPLFWRLTS